MDMRQFIAIDLGSTNLKAGLYDETLKCVAMEKCPVIYERHRGQVEFDAEAYFDALLALLTTLLRHEGAQPRLVCNVTLTGQAESLVVLGKDGRPLMNAISWMDERSTEECDSIRAQFPHDVFSMHTGQQAVLPTWPATKILWLRRHCPDVFSRAKQYLLLKDYIVYRLTGRLLADRSIATFTFYFDIFRGQYWPDMLEACGIDSGQLPLLVEPCTAAGFLLAEIASCLGLTGQVDVNIGTLDHFASMIGVGNTAVGTASLSIGTVMALAVLAGSSPPVGSGIALHYGFRPGELVMLPVAESGGICLEWFRKTCMPGVRFAHIDSVLQERNTTENTIVFLPYLVGSNAPELESNVSGLFYGLRSEHDSYDMAYAVMEGVAFLLRKNIEFITACGTPVEQIIATGGGARSDLWCQLQADVSGIPVVIPEQMEAACLGAAMIGAVSCGVYGSLREAAATVKIRRRFTPCESERLSRKYRQFQLLYDAMRRVEQLGAIGFERDD